MKVPIEADINQSLSFFMLKYFEKTKILLLVFLEKICFVGMH